MSNSALIRSLAVLSFAISLAACNGPSTLRGKISDQNGTQQQGLSDTGGLGGTGTVSTAASVRVMSINPDGTLAQLAYSSTVQVSASGEYSIELQGGERLIVQALDAQGAVIASAVVENVQPGGQEYFAPPMDTETSVEAAVLVQMVRRGSSREQANAIDVRARINAQVAAAVKASSDQEVKVQALADAIIAAQRTEDESYRQSNLTVTQDAVFGAEVQAAAKLNAALHRGDAAQQAYATFFAELAEARARVNVTAQHQAKAESCGSSAFRATLQARLSASGSADPVVDASIRQAAALEAGASAAAVEATLRAAGAADATVTAAVNAASTLRASMSAAASAADSAQAVAAYRAAIQGEGSMSGSVLGNFLELSLSTQIVANAALLATAGATTAMHATLGTTFETALSTTGTVNFTALAAAVVSAHATYEAAVRAQAVALAVFGTKASTALDVMVVTSGSYSTW